MNFWTGIIIGVIVGSNIGMIIAGMLGASKRSDDATMLQPDHYPMDEAVVDDAIPASFSRSSANPLQVEPAQPHSLEA